MIETEALVTKIGNSDIRLPEPSKKEEMLFGALMLFYGVCSLLPVNAVLTDMDYF